MRKIITIIFCCISLVAFCQRTAYTTNDDFEKEIEHQIKFSVPLISVSDLKENQDQYILLDIREKEEFMVSHIPGAQHVGYDRVNFNLLDSLNKEVPIVVYCSIGYRSEKVGELLQERGFKKVYNLFGSIFEWSNQNQPLHNSQNELTNELHTYDKNWSKWVTNKNIKKTW